MAKEVVKNFTMLLGGTDYAGQTRGRDLGATADQHETTNGDSGDWKEFIGGLKEGELSVDLVKDGDLSGLDAAMWAALGTTITFATKKTDAAVSGSNAQYSGNAVVLDWKPFEGKVGDLFAGTIKLKPTGTITRATA